MSEEVGRKHTVPVPHDYHPAWSGTVARIILSSNRKKNDQNLSKPLKMLHDVQQSASWRAVAARRCKQHRACSPPQY